MNDFTPNKREHLGRPGRSIGMRESNWFRHVRAFTGPYRVGFTREGMCS
jgi:hypothetical protein